MWPAERQTNKIIDATKYRAQGVSGPQAINVEVYQTPGGSANLAKYMKELYPTANIGVLVAGNNGRPLGALGHLKGTARGNEIHLNCEVNFGDIKSHTTQEEDIVSNWLATEMYYADMSKFVSRRHEYFLGDQEITDPYLKKQFDNLLNGTKQTVVYHVGTEEYEAELSPNQAEIHQTNTLSKTTRSILFLIIKQANKTSLQDYCEQLIEYHLWKPHPNGSKIPKWGMHVPNPWRQCMLLGDANVIKNQRFWLANRNDYSEVTDRSIVDRIRSVFNGKATAYKINKQLYGAYPSKELNGTVIEATQVNTDTKTHRNLKSTVELRLPKTNDIYETIQFPNKSFFDATVDMYNWAHSAKALLSPKMSEDDRRDKHLQEVKRLTGHGYHADFRNSFECTLCFVAGPNASDKGVKELQNYQTYFNRFDIQKLASVDYEQTVARTFDKIASDGNDINKFYERVMQAYQAGILEMINAGCTICVLCHLSGSLYAGPHKTQYTIQKARELIQQVVNHLLRNNQIRSSVQIVLCEYKEPFSKYYEYRVNLNNGIRQTH